MSEDTSTNSPATTPAPKRPVHAPQGQFPIQHGELCIGDIPITRLAQRVGQTPFYAYDRQLVTASIQELLLAFEGKVELHYAVKANPFPALVSHIAPQLDGFDVASAQELKIALDAGMPASRISFAGPGKRKEELTQAVAAGILLHIESFREAELLAEISNTLGLPARVAVRVNPDFELKSSGMKMGGGAKPFGVDAEQVPALLATIHTLGLEFEGFHLFAGSQNLRAEAIIEAQQLSYALALKLAAHVPRPVLSLNLGGGFGIPYFPGETALNTDPILTNLLELAERATRELPKAKLAIELGRYLVGEAGVYVCRVLDRKESRGQVFLITDGGMHHHLAASGNLGQVIRKNYPVMIANRADATEKETVSITGPLCTPLDILAERMELPRAQPGDLIAVLQSGAYGASASPQDFLSHPHVVEVLV